MLKSQILDRNSQAASHMEVSQSHKDFTVNYFNSNEEDGVIYKPALDITSTGSNSASKQPKWISNTSL